MLQLFSIIGLNRLCLGGGTVYTAVLEAVPVRVASSNLARGTTLMQILTSLHQNGSNKDQLRCRGVRSSSRVS